MSIYPASGESVTVFARTLYGEARGEILEGQIAVAWCIRHRAEMATAYEAVHGKPHPLYGNGSIADVCHMPWQFSCWNKNDPTRAAMLSVGMADPDFQRATLAALQVLLGLANDRLPGTTHYLNPAAVPKPPVWVATATLAGTIGHHQFYRDVK